MKDKNKKLVIKPYHTMVISTANNLRCFGHVLDFILRNNICIKGDFFFSFFFFC